MSSIDERVVKMKIDNSQFQSGVKSTSSLLEKLKQSLKLKGATDGIDKVSSAVSKFNMSGMQEAAISTGSKFSAMAAVAFSAILLRVFEKVSLNTNSIWVLFRQSWQTRQTRVQPLHRSMPL